MNAPLHLNGLSTPRTAAPQPEREPEPENDLTLDLKRMIGERIFIEPNACKYAYVGKLTRVYEASGRTFAVLEGATTQLGHPRVRKSGQPVTYRADNGYNYPESRDDLCKSMRVEVTGAFGILEEGHNYSARNYVS